MGVNKGERSIVELEAPSLNEKQLKILRNNAKNNSRKVADYIYKKNHGPHVVRPYSPSD